MSKGKIGKHMNVTKEMKHWIENVRRNKNVNKVILGIAENARHKYTPGTILFRQFTDTGLQFRAYTGRGVRDVFVCCDPEHRELLKQTYGSE